MIYIASEFLYHFYASVNLLDKHGYMDPSSYFIYIEKYKVKTPITVLNIMT
jgi:hypothetical protein